MNTQKKNGWCDYKMMESLSPTRIVSLDVEECWNTIVRHSNTHDLKSEVQELQYHASEAYGNSQMAKIENWVSKSTRWGTWDRKPYCNDYFSSHVVLVFFCFVRHLYSFPKNNILVLYLFNIPKYLQVLYLIQRRKFKQK